MGKKEHIIDTHRQLDGQTAQLATENWLRIHFNPLSLQSRSSHFLNFTYEWEINVAHTTLDQV